MKKIKIIAGITWAVACLVLIIILFPGLNGFSAAASKLTFMKIHPRYSGGEVADQIVSGSCTLDIRKPVFKGLVSDRKRGFVQIDWRGNIPEIINDTIDYDLDNKPDFCILVDRKSMKSKIYPFNSRAGDIIISTATSYGWSVRVELTK